MGVAKPDPIVVVDGVRMHTFARLPLDSLRAVNTVTRPQGANDPACRPTPEQQRTGSFDIRLYGIAADGRSLRAKVTGDRDPGYGSTGKMLGEAVVCLALDVPKSEVGGGFWTPATALGEKLIRRLTAHAGLTFSILD